MSVSVVIFEDNNSLRDSISTLLQSTTEFEVIGSFPNCKEAKEKVKSLKPAVVLMDIDMPGKSGIEAVKEIRSFNTAVHIIMLTVFDDSSHVYDAICAGASGYLLKRYIAERLASSINEVMNGGAPMSPSIAKMVIQSMQKVPKSNTNNADQYQLTSREKEILSLLSNGNSYKLIASSLQISIDTVRTHLKRVYEKLQVHSQTEAISKAIQEKLV